MYKWILLLSLFSLAWSSPKVRLKDLVQINGMRANKLIGYGVVFGLAGTGDSAASQTTLKSVSQMLNKLGVENTVPELSLGNFASVLLTADLAPFTRNGDRIDIRVSANGDAESLAGGTLVLSQLRAGDGKTYAVAQGPLVIAGAGGEGASVLTVANIPRGGLVERDFIPKIQKDGQILLRLQQPDFIVNTRIKQEINRYFKGLYAESEDPAMLRVSIPEHYDHGLIEFVSEIEKLQVVVDQKAVVVLNERTGTVVMGQQVLIGPISIAHGELTLKVESEAEDGKHLMQLEGSSVGDMVESLNLLGVKPVDLVGILQAIDAAGALYGELIFI